MKTEVLRFIFPRRCPCCHEVIPQEFLICPMCKNRFKRVEPPFCFKCGRHIDDEQAEYCEECNSRKHSYVQGFAVFEYDRLMKRSMSDFKFYGWAQNSDYYVFEAVKTYGRAILQFAPDAVVPVPVHSSKRAFRGYNQAELLARGIGEKLGISVMCDFLLRNRRTSAQKQLGKDNRYENLRNAFSCREFKCGTAMRPQSVLIVDDIYTTGSTMEGCTQALMAAGVRRVAVLSICIGSGF